MCSSWEALEVEEETYQDFAVVVVVAFLPEDRSQQGQVNVACTMLESQCQQGCSSYSLPKGCSQQGMESLEERSACIEDRLEKAFFVTVAVVQLSFLNLTVLPLEVIDVLLCLLKKCFIHHLYRLSSRSNRAVMATMM